MLIQPAYRWDNKKLRIRAGYEPDTYWLKKKLIFWRDNCLMLDIEVILLMEVVVRLNVLSLGQAKFALDNQEMMDSK